MAAEETTTGRHPAREDEAACALAARKLRGRPRHGTELGSAGEASPRPGPARQLSTHFPIKPDTPRPSEPILVPKLRIKFADFPYLH
jgi:hypothetical protein